MENKPKYILGGVLFIVLILIITIFLNNNGKKTDDIELKSAIEEEVAIVEEEKIPCNGEKKLAIVEGTSMEPKIKNGTKVEYYSGYYNCMELVRGDIIVYRFGGKVDLIKEVKAIEGDTFEYNNNKIFINGDILKNSEGLEYNINSKILELYSKQNPVLPEGTLLILGDNINGSLDSSRFGLISKKDLKGKVIFK